MIHFFSAFLLLSLGAAPAVHAAGTAHALDEVSGCDHGKANEQARNYCSNYTEIKAFASDQNVKAAALKCQAFYEVALRLQNTFCSYSSDAVIFQVTSVAAAQAEVVGEANVSQSVASEDNRTVANINKVYMDKISELALKLKKAYEDYSISIGKMNSGAQSDELAESLCQPSQVRGQVPGALRSLLATLSQSTGHLTFESMFAAARSNLRNLKSVKETAENNAGLAKMNAIQTGQVMKDTVEAPSTPKPVDDTIVLQSGMDKFLAANGAQGTLQLVSALVNTKLVPGAGIVGGIFTLVYNEKTGKAVQYSDTAISLVAVLGIPGALTGAALTVLNYQAKATAANLHTYQDFSRDELRTKINESTMDLMAEWARRTKNTSCQAAVEKEKACIISRPTMQMYEHNSCSLSPIMDMQGPPGPNYRNGPLPPGY